MGMRIHAHVRRRNQSWAQLRALEPLLAAIEAQDEATQLTQ